MSNLTYTAIGYHGCPGECADEVRERGASAIDMGAGWLGEGIYFWDNDPKTGEWWASQAKGHPRPAVVEAEIDMQNALDLTTVIGQNALKKVCNLNISDDLEDEFEKILEEQGSETEALLTVARKWFEAKTSERFKCLRAPVHMEDENDTMSQIGKSRLLSGFRMIVVVFDRSIIGKTEVSYVD